MPKDKDKRRGDLKAVKIIPELTQMTGFTDQQRQNYKMMNVSAEQSHHLTVHFVNSGEVSFKIGTFKRYNCNYWYFFSRYDNDFTQKDALLSA